MVPVCLLYCTQMQRDYFVQKTVAHLRDKDIQLQWYQPVHYTAHKHSVTILYERWLCITMIMT